VIITSRQLAIVLWLVIFVIWVLTVKSVRSSVRSMLTTLFSPKLFALFTVIIGYNAAAVWLLWRVGYWDAAMLYDTMTFVAVGGIGSVSKAATRGITYDVRFFFKTVLFNLEVMVLFAFLSDFFPFNFWVEFLLVIPFITLLAMLVVVAQYRKDGEPVHRFLRGVQSGIGLLLIAYVAWRVVESFKQLMHVQVLFSLGLPFLMSVLFVPVLFFVCAAFAYEDAFLVVSFKSGDDKQLRRWKKRRLLLRFGLNLIGLQAFRRSRAIHEFGWVKTKDEARACLKLWTAVPLADHSD